MRFSRPILRLGVTATCASAVCAGVLAGSPAQAGTGRLVKPASIGSTSSGGAGAGPATIPGTAQPDLPPAQAKATKAVSKLRRTLNHDINGYGGHNSALVIDETTDRTLWDYNVATPRLPASVEKLYTTSTALLKLGAAWRTSTRIYGSGKLEADGTFKGTLYLKGGGDPTLGSAGFDRAAYGTGATVQKLAAQLKAAGVKAIDGAVVADASWFDSRLGGPDTGYHENIETEGALSALTYDAGFTNDYEEKLVSHPALVATQKLVAAARDAGIKVPKKTRVKTGKTPAGAKLITRVFSPDLAQLMLLTNSPSDNFFAETLLKQLGRRYAGHGSTAAGASVVRAEIAAKFGMRPRLDDGSGLSRYDQTTAEQVVYLLRRMQSHPTFWNSLAIAGVRGTMQYEMLGTRAVDNCRGKTGTLDDVANLAGYCTAANGDKLVFAFLMNGLRDSDSGHYLEDLAGEALANFRG